MHNAPAHTPLHAILAQAATQRPQTYEPAFWPDQRVSIHCDYSAGPCWNSYGAPESPFSLPIPHALAQRIMAWFAWFDAHASYTQPADIAPENRAWFHAEGARIAQALRAALPNGWEVRANIALPGDVPS